MTESHTAMEVLHHLLEVSEGCNPMSMPRLLFPFQSRECDHCVCASAVILGRHKVNDFFFETVHRFKADNIKMAEDLVAETAKFVEATEADTVSRLRRAYPYMKIDTVRSIAEECKILVESRVGAE